MFAVNAFKKLPWQAKYCIYASIAFSIAAVVIYTVGKNDNDSSTPIRILWRVFSAVAGFLALSAIHGAYQARRAQEATTDKGDPVFINRYMSAGRLRHYVLAVRDWKYELRRDESNTSKSIFVCKQGFDITTNPPGRRWLPGAGRGRIPGYGDAFDGYTTSGYRYENLMYGWTSKTHEEIVVDGQETIVRYQPYNLWSNNCQEFVRELAASITVDDEHRTGETKFLVKLINPLASPEGFGKL